MWSTLRKPIWAPEVTRIDSDLDEDSGAGLKEQAAEKALVLIGKRGQLVREREDHMNVGNGQKFLAALRQPAVARTGLTLGAVPVATRDGPIATTSTTIPMAAQRGGAATLDSLQHLPLRLGQPGPAPFDKALALGANDIGHLEGVGRIISCAAGANGERFQSWTRSGYPADWRRPGAAVAKVQIDDRVPELGMAEQKLNGAEVGPCF